MLSRITTHNRGLFNQSTIKQYMKLFVIKNNFSSSKITTFHKNTKQQENSIKPHSNKITYSFSQFKTSHFPQQRITAFIQQCSTVDELKKIVLNHRSHMNFIHRIALIQKVTSSPFDRNSQLNNLIIQNIRQNWKIDFSQITDKNSRAIANLLNYISRKKKNHSRLIEELSSVNFEELAKFVNSKEFVMALNGILKLNLQQKIISNYPKFNLIQFVLDKIDHTYPPPLLVSIWFNMLKFNKSNEEMNDYFAEKIKMKVLKNNLIDYSQFIFCFNRSYGKRTVDLSYPLMAYPTQINPRDRSPFGASQLSILYDQLAQVKKIQDIYYSEQFDSLLHHYFKKIIQDPNLSLRNISNIFHSMLNYEVPNAKIVSAIYFKYYMILKNQIEQIKQKVPGQINQTTQSSYRNHNSQSNIDPLSYVSLFESLMKHHKQQNDYMEQHIKISMIYLTNIISEPSIMKNFNQPIFIRLLSTIQTAKKIIQQRHSGKTLSLNQFLKKSFQKIILQRDFQNSTSLTKLIHFVNLFDIRSKLICNNFNNLIEQLPQNNFLRQRLKQKCILNTTCRNCANCFSAEK